MSEIAPPVVEVPPVEAPPATPAVEVIEPAPPLAAEVQDDEGSFIIALADGTPDPGWKLVTEDLNSVTLTKKAATSGGTITSKISRDAFMKLNPEGIPVVDPGTEPASAEADKAPSYVTVERSDGTIENDWQVVGGNADSVVVYKAVGDEKLTKTIPGDKFRELNGDLGLTKPPDAAPEPDPAPTPKQENYIAETTAETAEADWERIYGEAKKYFELFKSADEQNQAKIIDQIVDLRGRLAKKAQETQAAMEAGLASLGYEDSADLAGAAEHTNQAVSEAITAEVPGLVEKAVPLTDPSKRAQKQVDKSRQRLSEMITMDQAAFDRLLEDWKLYNRDQKHAEALAEQKDVKVSLKRQEARTEMAELRQRYGNSIDSAANLPLSKEAGGATDQALLSYKEGLKTIGPVSSPVAKALRNINLDGTVAKLQSHLSEKYLAEGLGEADIQRRLEESKVVLKEWLANSGPDDQQLEDLQKFSNARNKEQLWDGQRQKVREFLGTTLMARSIRSALQMEQSQSPPNINIAEVLARGVDHDGSRAKAGAEAILNPDRVGSYVGRVMVQMEMARDLGRHEGLMKIPIYLTALDNSLTDGFISAWEAIPDEKKQQARKKMMMGMAITSRSLRRLYVRARAKAAEQKGQK